IGRNLSGAAFDRQWSPTLGRRILGCDAGSAAPERPATGSRRSTKERAMATSLATYISLPGNTAVVFNHRRSVFGGSLELMKYGDTDVPDVPFNRLPTLSHTLC